MKIVVEIVTRTEEIHSLRRTDVEPGNRATEQNVWAKYWSGWHQCSEQTVLFGMHLNSADRLGSTPTGLSINDVTNFFDKSWSLYPFVTYKSPVFEMENSRLKKISAFTSITFRHDTSLKLGRFRTFGFRNEVFLVETFPDSLTSRFRSTFADDFELTFHKHCFLAQI